MKDPRLRLKKKLEKEGVSVEDASTISLEAGSSQSIVDRDYLKRFTYPKKTIKKCLKKINKFYSGQY